MAPKSISCSRGDLPMLSSCSFFFLLSFLLLILSTSPCTEAYKNYTVGGSKGWYDDLSVPGVDYQEWADGENFSLGDFLIFNTDKNHSVVQTYNQTLYKSCDYIDSGPEDTIEWSASAPEFSKDAVTVAVPLLKEGPTYFFSGDYDGEQCQHGQRFTITVAHGQGLPPDLMPPSNAAPAPADPDDVPATVVPGNFDHPIDVNTAPPVKPASGAAGRTLAGLGLGLVMLLLGVLVVV